MYKSCKKILFSLFALLAILATSNIVQAGGFGAGFGWGFLGGALAARGNYGYYPNAWYQTGYYPTSAYGYYPYGYYGYYPRGSYGNYGYPGDYFYW